MMKVIIVGGSSGIGARTAKLLADQNHKVLITGRNLQRLRQVSEHSTNISFHLYDSSNDDHLQALVNWVEKNWEERVDGLVNSSGAFALSALNLLERDDFIKVLQVNAIGPAITVKALLPFLKTANGSIVNVSSIAASVAWRNSSAYASSKAALNQLTRIWAVELAPDIRVNAVAPGPTKTDILTNSGLSQEEAEELRQNEKNATPLQRIASPENIADSVSFLLSSRASHITGQILQVDGGLGA